MSGDLDAYEEISVRDLDRGADLGIPTCDPPISNLKTRGWGELTSEAHDEIRERIELEEHRGETVATVYYDLEEWSYSIEWHVERSIVDRLRRLVDSI